MLSKKAIAHTIDAAHLLSRSATHLVALSGGADSVALLRVLLSLGYRVEAAHCNFHLRGKESDRDEAFCRQLCERLGVELHLAHFDTSEYAALHKMSIEMAARELRYRYFEELRRDIGADAICVAHHRDDAVETLLMNLMRGTGIHGLTGIRMRNGHIVRPLLHVSRKDITAYLSSIGQDYVTDSSNLEPEAALRNQIRLRLTPLMEEILPNSQEGIARTAANIAQAESVYNAAIESSIKWATNELGCGRLSIDTGKLLAGASPQSLLHEIVQRFGFSPFQTEQMLEAIADGQPGKTFSSATHEMLVDRHQLIIEPKGSAVAAMQIPEPGLYNIGGLRLRFSVSEDVTVSKSADCATVDADRACFPLTVRTIASGDRFHPFGMTGTRLVSDYLTDLKLSLFDKRRQLVVTDSDGRIVWLVGHRTDHRFRISADSKHVLTIRSST